MKYYFNKQSLIRLSISELNALLLSYERNLYLRDTKVQTHSQITQVKKILNLKMN